MSYTILNAVMLAVVLLCAASAVLLRRPALRPALAAAGVSVAVLFLLTAVCDSLMIAGGLMEYNAEHLIGWFIALAPIEDFAYPLAAVILLPALWLLLGPRLPTASTKGAPDVD